MPLGLGSPRVNCQGMGGPGSAAALARPLALSRHGGYPEPNAMRHLSCALPGQAFPALPCSTRAGIDIGRLPTKLHYFRPQHIHLSCMTFAKATLLAVANASPSTMLKHMRACLPHGRAHGISSGSSPQANGAHATLPSCGKASAQHGGTNARRDKPRAGHGGRPVPKAGPWRRAAAA